MVTAMRDLLWLIVIVGGGITLGVFVAVAVSVAPALRTLPPDSYVRTQTLLGRGYHPLMPIVTNVTTVSGVWLLLTAGSTVQLVLLTVLVISVIGVQAVSHLGNVPLNRQIAHYEAIGLAGWVDPRPRWGAWHRVRTALAATCELAAVTAALLAH